MVQELRERVVAEVGKVVVSREKETELLLVALLARGHALLEGVPGVSKTLLARAFSRCMGLDFRRVQFTPDMLPLDIVGGFVFDMKERELEFRQGPIFTNILLADEINRAPPKVQSALLEAMQERQVTVEGHTEILPSPHMVIATQNPIEFQGVYPLPEGQLDRFILKIVLGYPSLLTESAIIRRNMSEPDVESVKPVVSREDLSKSLERVRAVTVSGEMTDYIARLAVSTRADSRISLGASPRAMVHLTHCAQARAYLSDRDYITPDDVKELSVHVLSHRIKLDQALALSGETADVTAILKDTLDRVIPPR